MKLIKIKYNSLLGNFREKEMRPYVCLGEKDNILYFFKIRTILNNQFKEVEELNLFAYDKINNTRTHSISNSFDNFNILNVSKSFNKNDFNTKIIYLKRHSIFSETAKRYFN